MYSLILTFFIVNKQMKSFMNVLKIREEIFFPFVFQNISGIFLCIYLCVSLAFRNNFTVLTCV